MQFRFSKYRLVLGTVFLSLVGTLAYTQTEVRIRELTEVTADGISSDGAVWFGVDKTDVPASRKISLAELKKTANVVTVANVAALYALPAATDNQLYQTFGYTTEGIGANIYRYDSGSSATPDYGFVLDGIGGDGSGTGTGRFIAVDQSRADVTQFGAVPDDEIDDVTKIQAAIDDVYAANGGIVYIPSGEFVISSALEIGTGIELIGNGQNSSIIRQATSNVSIVAITKAATNYFWKIKGLRLSYDTQQTSAETSAFGIQLAEANTNSYLGTVEDVQIQQAYQGVSLPNAVGCTGFLIRMQNVHARSCADYGFYLVGASTGARTNIVLNECWVEQVAGSEVSTSKGFHIAYTDGFRMSNCGCDHIQEQRALYILSSNGTIGTFWAESCDITASTSKSLIDINGSIVHIGSLYSAYNTVNLSGSADYSLLRAQSTSNVTVGHLIDKYTEMTDTSSGAYYTVQASSSDIVSVGDFQYIAGSSPANNGNLADFGTVKYVRNWDNNERTSVRGGKIHTYGTAAPVSGTWSVGDVVWNTAPAAGTVMGWVCTTAGTPGTWKTFGAIAP